MRRNNPVLRAACLLVVAARAHSHSPLCARRPVDAAAAVPEAQHLAAPTQARACRVHRM